MSYIELLITPNKFGFRFLATKIITIIDTSITHIRPRFKFSVPGAAEEVLGRIKALLAEAAPPLTGKVVGEHIILDIAPVEAHFWSPQLNFRVEEDETTPGRTIIAGLIGPRPSVWTMFMFCYFSIGIAGFFISSYGISRYMIGEHTFALYGFPIAIAIMLSAYYAGRIGERLGADQIELLKNFVRQAVGPDRIKVS